MSTKCFFLKHADINQLRVCPQPDDVVIFASAVQRRQHVKIWLRFSQAAKEGTTISHMLLRAIQPSLHFMRLV